MHLVDYTILPFTKIPRDITAGGTSPFPLKFPVPPPPGASHKQSCLMWNKWTKANLCPPPPPKTRTPSAPTRSKAPPPRAPTGKNPSYATANALNMCHLVDHALLSLPLHRSGWIREEYHRQADEDSAQRRIQRQVNRAISYPSLPPPPTPPTPIEPGGTMLVPPIPEPPYLEKRIYPPISSIGYHWQLQKHSFSGLSRELFPRLRPKNTPFPAKIGIRMRPLMHSSVCVWGGGGGGGGAAGLV